MVYKRAAMDLLGFVRCAILWAPSQTSWIKICLTSVPVTLIHARIQESIGLSHTVNMKFTKHLACTRHVASPSACVTLTQLSTQTYLPLLGDDKFKVQRNSTLWPLCPSWIQILAIWFPVQSSFQSKHGYPRGLDYATVTAILKLPVIWQLWSVWWLRGKNSRIVSLKTFSLPMWDTSINKFKTDFKKYQFTKYTQKKFPFILALSFMYLFHYFHQHPTSFYLLSRVGRRGVGARQGK